MLDRESLSNGAFLTSFRDAPGIEWWSEERIDSSLREMLSRRVDEEPIWLFAYGSLICNPLFEFEERVGATLNGWRRSFCVRLVVARGSHEKPGRMLALEPGGIVQGLALKLPKEHVERELRMIWMREMVSGIYQPDWADVSLEDGRTVAAIIFKANPDSPLYERDASTTSITPFIASASGSLGTNVEYVVRLGESLKRHGIEDSYITDVINRIAAER